MANDIIKSIKLPNGTTYDIVDNSAVHDNNYVHTDNNYTTTEKNKLAGIAAGAEVNVQADWNVTDSTSDAFIKNKPTIPEGAKLYSTTGQNTDGAMTQKATTDALAGKLNTSLKGAAEGLAELDANGKVPSTQLPSYVDDVLEYESKSAFPTTGESGKIYIAKDTNKTYRWSGSAYVEISASLALGETSSTAYRGDRGKIAYDHSQTAHAPSNAEPNQNAFSNIKVGTTTVAADTATDTVELIAGNNVTLTPNATNDSITITATDTTYTHPAGGAASKASGFYKFSTDATSHVASVTAVTKSDITGLGIPGTDTNTTYTLSQDSTDGHKITLTPSTGTATTITIPDNDTKYTGSNGVSVSGTVISNSGVRSITQDSSDGHKLTINTNGSSSTITIPDNDTTYESKSAASGGTAVSLVTTGEKYTWNNKGTYSKPSTGIPKSDLASAVQSSLDKADSALQEAPVTSVAGKTGAVTLAKGDVGLGNVGNFKAVSTVASQGLTDTEKSNARTNIGAGTSNLTLGTSSTTAYRGDYGNAAYQHSQSAHAPSNAEENQNAFSNITVGSTTVSADSKTDTLTLVAGNNVTLTPDATNDKITIAATNTTYSGSAPISVSGTTISHSTAAGYKHIPSGGSAGQVLGWDSAGTAKWQNPVSGGMQLVSNPTAGDILTTDASGQAVDSGIGTVAGSVVPIVTTIASTSTDSQVPSAKAVYTLASSISIGADDYLTSSEIAAVKTAIGV